MKELQPHQQRVVTERDELQEKLTRLEIFTESEKFSEIVKDQSEQNRMQRQKEIMRVYANILNERINAF